MKPILEIQNVSKKFRINHEQQPYLSIRDSVANMFKSKNSKEDFWALKEVSFDVMPGDTVGIIGKNGAGKSTLLKILSKITPPTSGKIIGRGRIASLLEVGTGFHPELSGRENIFMNGSILGMRKSEILKNFDAIVDFAGVEKFIDTPLKHYSSGMQLRLAFAVAAFLENEILIIDEVLAVGDAEFQKKCMGKMGDVSKSGRTILFVSHQMSALSQLCATSILLRNGSIVAKDRTKTIIDTYLSTADLANGLSNKYVLTKSASQKKEMLFLELYTADITGKEQALFEYGDEVCFHMKIFVNQVMQGVKVGVALLSRVKNRVFADYIDIKPYYEQMTENTIHLVMKIPVNILAPGTYSFGCGLVVPNGPNIDIVEDIADFTIANGNNLLPEMRGVDFGDVMVECKWNYINEKIIA